MRSAILAGKTKQYIKAFIVSEIDNETDLSALDAEIDALMEDIDEEAYNAHVDTDLAEVTKTISSESERRVGADAYTWNIAADLVGEFRPVPIVLWSIIRSVLGKPGIIQTPSPQQFSSLSPLLFQAAVDETLGNPALAKSERRLFLNDVVEDIGYDACAAICFLYSVCRRVTYTLAERVWRPILDDALIRATIGYHVGANCPSFGAGRGTIAGFSGRSGLAIQIASGDLAQAQAALEKLASGMEISKVGRSVYGCEPLQVSALTVAAAGLSREAALGVAAYSLASVEVEPYSPQHQWLSAFTIIEHLRMGSSKNIPREYWASLDYDDAEIEEVNEIVQQLFRTGHSWEWITWSQMAMFKQG